MVWLAVLMLAGCASAPVTKSKTFANKVTTQKPAGFDLPAIKYPADMTNYVWSAQWSPDLVHWFNLGMNTFKGPVGTVPLNIKETGVTKGFFG